MPACGAIPTNAISDCPIRTRAPFGTCLSIDEDGIISALNVDGKDLIDLLHLNDSPAIDTRKTYIRIIKLKSDFPQNAEVYELFLDAFGYPDHLPDLTSLRPPRGNLAKPGSVLSYHELRRLNQLSEVY